MLDSNALYEGDCLDLMAGIDDHSIDMILCDLPYGTTACHWDSVIPFEPLWAHYKRIIKPHGAIVLTASQPFTSALVMSNIKWFKYEWVWDKGRGVGFLSAKKQPMKCTEDVLVFGNGSIKYNPQMRKRDKARISLNRGLSECYGYFSEHFKGDVLFERYPINLIEFTKSDASSMSSHPTQKPVPLFAYLIRTYTDAGDLVLDNCAGSGTTAIAALQTKRRYILMEKDPAYCEVIRKRIAEWKADEQLDLIPDPRDVQKEEQASLL